MSKVISIANRKGGVGKTTLSIALAETYIAEQKANVVIIDLDPQSSASELLLSEEKYKSLMDEGKMLSDLWSVKSGFSRSKVDPKLVKGLTRLLGHFDVEFALLPNSAALWDLEYDVLRKRQMPKYQTRVQSTLEALKKSFDVVIIDCPPGRLLAADTIISASDIVLCPIVPRKLSLLGMGQMQRYFLDLAKSNKRVPPWKFVWSKYEERTREAKSCIAKVNESTFAKHFLVEEQTIEDIAKTQRQIQLSQRAEIVNCLSAYSEGAGIIKSFDSLYKRMDIELRAIVNAIENTLEA